jgi:hypothetical protein
MTSKIFYLRDTPNNGEDELNQFLATLKPFQIVSVSVVPLIGANVQKVIIIHS